MGSRVFRESTVPPSWRAYWWRPEVIFSTWLRGWSGTAVWARAATPSKVRAMGALMGLTSFVARLARDRWVRDVEGEPNAGSRAATARERIAAVASKLFSDE